VIFPRFLLTPSPVFWRSVIKPLASPRCLPQGRASVPGFATTTALFKPPDQTIAVLAPVNIVRRKQRQRWRPAIGWTGPAAAPALLTPGVRPIASPRRMPPGRANVTRALITPSQVLGPSVLKPLASPRRPTPGRALVWHCAPNPTLLVTLRGFSISRLPSQHFYDLLTE
jgi:hypothetical protein